MLVCRMRASDEHFHRWVPFAVLPFFFIARPQIGHFFALLDFVLTTSSPPPDPWHKPAIFPPSKITSRHAYCHKARCQL
ncbi:hypothetical protein BTIS_0955 [Bifidobacterium tissieri]|uniref:Uncharacterized protein n=1 Tax=Bifidobacterium tissieri TaxID=1630162 RepID=A0A261FG39_9BIFI|nr:hypothetical protein BTIS_0955 [Bifidobacterium tissieri]TPF95697.1 hypothetical protein EP30_10410 [Bifidobacterium sp. UTCIF-39]